ncbi:MAG: hypothetical protein E6J34_15615 [Chloroflexi bacterium]|nr:MAG: hypothetical protein E6J34_15615 [Chloroflexota bacterium]
MALQSVLQCVPTALHSTMSIYRVKPRNEYTPAGEVLYKRTRYVIIYQEGFALCTCLLGRHLGIPCSHFFAVMQRFPEKHGFNIAQVHQKWHNPFGRERCLDRPWIYLETANDNILPKNEDDFMNATLNTRNPDDETSSQPPTKATQQDPRSIRSEEEGQRNNDRSPNPGRNPMRTSEGTEMFEHLYLTPRQSRPPRPGKKEYVEMVGFMEKFMKSTDSPERIRKFKNIFQTEFADIAEKRKLAHQKIALPSQDTSQSIESSHNHAIEEPLDPLPRIRRGRNQSKRIKSSLEESTKKRRKITKEKQE